MRLVAAWLAATCILPLMFLTPSMRLDRTLHDAARARQGPGSLE
jgi:hypothetical protein